ncbi:fungal-specific transcription factor domain-containing protein [Fennellomyces sp. T-0311]|nr:fungal-specific transcription factor domain-containing protein [Fennellomyces sp. T-0311]
MNNNEFPWHQPESWSSTPNRPLLIRPRVNTSDRGKSIDIPRTKRLRARRSCNFCRLRKMRCNSDIAQPCYGCTKFGMECHFRHEDQRVTRSLESFENRIGRLEVLLKRALRQRRGQRLEEQPPITIKEDTPKLTYENDDTSLNQDLLCVYKDLVSSNATLELVEQMNLLQLGDYGTTRYIGNSSGVQLIHQFKTKHHYKIKDERPFILEKLNSDDNELVILKAEGVQKPSPHPQITQSVKVLQDIPNLTEELIDLMIHSYFTFIQPHLPLLNKLSFLQQYYYQNPHPPDEYLLSTMCAVAADFLNIQDDIVAGTDIDRGTLKSIQKCLRDKAIKILQVAHRRSQVTTLQTLIILTLFICISSWEDDEEDSIHWLIAGTAINMAQNLGLHRNSTKWNIPESENELRRRLWYCVYGIDVWIAAELGRPLAISDDTFDVDLPSVFEIDSPYHTIRVEKEKAMAHPLLITQAEASLREKQEYPFFLRLILLTQKLKQVLSTLYSPVANNTIRTSIKVINSIDDELNTWKSSVPKNLQYSGINSTLSSFVSGILFVLYNCVKIVLHRPLLENPDAVDSVSLIRSQRVCSTAALNIIDTMEVILPSLSFYIPRYIIGYSVFQAATIFMLSATSKDEREHCLGCRNLARCAAAYTVNNTLYRSARLVDQLARVLSASYSNQDTLQLTSININNGISNDTNHRRIDTRSAFRNTSPESLFYSSLPSEFTLFQDVAESQIHHINQNLGIPRSVPAELSKSGEYQPLYSVPRGFPGVTFSNSNDLKEPNTLRPSDPHNSLMNISQTRIYDDFENLLLGDMADESCTDYFQNLLLNDAFRSEQDQQRLETPRRTDPTAGLYMGLL